jgi:hypothetical protein
MEGMDEMKQLAQNSEGEGRGEAAGGGFWGVIDMARFLRTHTS